MRFVRHSTLIAAVLLAACGGGGGDRPPAGDAEAGAGASGSAGGVTHEIATVKGADPKGSGTGRVEPSGAGGSMQVEGKDAEGRSVRLTVECGRWTEPVAEGG